MNTRRRFSILFLLLLVWLSLPGRLSAQFREQVEVRTDRSYFMAGETLWFGVQRNPGSDVFSTVVYAELVTPRGTPVAQKKLALDESGATGSFLLPGDLSSGSYYVRAYTKWMRNCGPESFAYSGVRIYNPYSQLVLPVDTLTSLTLGSPESDEDASRDLQVRLPGTTFANREAVELELGWTGRGEAGVSVSVVPRGTLAETLLRSEDCRPEAHGPGEVVAEIQDASLSGSVVDASTGDPVPFATIYLTLLGAQRVFQCNYADSSGRFYFSFPGEMGSQDVFISAFREGVEKVELLLDQDFSTDVLSLPSLPVNPPAELDTALRNLSLNAQIARQYGMQEGTTPAGGATETSGFPLFYGSPSAVIRFDDFIRLPTMTEYFTEVVPQVSIRRTRGMRHFQVLGEHPDLLVYPPLLLIDGVAIFDLEAILALSPRLIERIEVVNAPYIHGNVTFGGIISLVSRNNDLAYIDLPESGLLVDFRMLEPEGAGMPAPELAEALPDVRNTLLWMPRIVLPAGETQTLTFRTGDTKGSYEAVVRGWDAWGQRIVRRLPFDVE
ncbi:MAG: hypothetical protein R2751_14055 [Bacteroidales bacterium]